MRLRPHRTSLLHSILSVRGGLKCETLARASKLSKDEWMKSVLDAMCYPRFLKRLVNPRERNIELNWRRPEVPCPTFDLLFDLDKKPYPLGFSSLKSFWGDHMQYCHEVSCALKIDLIRMGQREADWKWIIAKDFLGYLA
jgi:hypothetical protein